MTTTAMNLNAQNAARIAREKADRLNQEETEETIVESKSQESALSGLIGGAAAKIKSETQNSASELDLTYHEKELIRLRSDPANGLLIQAKARGLKAASDFIKSASDSTHPLHKNSFPEFRNRFNLDARLVENHFVAVASKELGAKPYEFRDLGYENTLLKAYKPIAFTDVIESKMYDLFCEGMQKKWAKEGYSSDGKAVAELSSVYNMKKNVFLAEYKQFQPKD